MKLWQGSAILLYGLSGLSCLAADPVSAANRAEVDLAIEWVRYNRPPAHPMAADASADHASNSLPGHVGQSQAWSLRTEDRRLSMALQRWCVLAGWQLVWEAERDFAIEVGIEIQGTLASALEQAMNSLQDSDYPLQAVMNVQTRVLRVRRQREVMQ